MVSWAARVSSNTPMMAASEVSLMRIVQRPTKGGGMRRMAWGKMTWRVVWSALSQAVAARAASRRAARRVGARSGLIFASSHWLKRDMLYVKIQ